MVCNKRSTTPTPTQQSHLDWNAPQQPGTPRGEYDRMMAAYAPVWAFQPASSTPFDGGMGAAQ